jgi:hypothetical protein
MADRTNPEEQDVSGDHPLPGPGVDRVGLDAIRGNVADLQRATVNRSWSIRRRPRRARCGGTRLLRHEDGSGAVTAESPERPAAYAVELRTARWAELVAWYRDALGLRVLVRAAEDGYALLAAATAAPTEPRTHAEGYREFTVTDPDGNRLRLFSWPAAGP